MVDGDADRVVVLDRLVEGDDGNSGALRFVDDAIESGAGIGVHRDDGDPLQDHVADVLDLLIDVRTGLLDDQLVGFPLGLVYIELRLRAGHHLVAPFGTEIAVRQADHHIARGLRPGRAAASPAAPAPTAAAPARNCLRSIRAFYPPFLLHSFLVVLTRSRTLPAGSVSRHLPSPSATRPWNGL